MDQDQRAPGHNQLDAFETNLIRVKAATLARRGLIPRADVEDVRQELSLAVLVAHGKVHLDAAKRHGLSYTVVKNAAQRLVRDRHYAKRNPYRLRSLGPLLADGEGVSEPATLDGGTVTERVVDLPLDLEAFLAGLPEELRTLAVLLKTLSVSEVAEKLGVPRTTLYSSLRVLRGRLRRAGFGKNLPQTADGSDAVGVVPS